MTTVKAARGEFMAGGLDMMAPCSSAAHHPRPTPAKAPHFIWSAWFGQVLVLAEAVPGWVLSVTFSFAFQIGSGDDMRKNISWNSIQ